MQNTIYEYSLLQLSTLAAPLLWHLFTIQGVSEKLNKSEIALRLCKAPQCTKFFIEIGCFGTYNVE